jgi:hypothetical protein
VTERRRGNQMHRMPWVRRSTETPADNRRASEANA